MPPHTTPFPPEALAENRGGHLTGDQARGFQLMVSGRRTSTRGVALPVGAIGALLLVLSGPAATAVQRRLAGWGFMAAAAVLLAAPTFDPLAADIRDGRVETVHGGEARDMLGRIARVLVSGDPVASAEARASVAGLIDAVQDSMIEPSASPSAPAGDSFAEPSSAGGRIRWSPSRWPRTGRRLSRQLRARVSRDTGRLTHRGDC